MQRKNNDRQLLVLDIFTANNSWLIIYPTHYTDARELQQSVRAREVVHVSNPDKLEVTPVYPGNVVASWSEDSSLPDLWEILQVYKPTALLEESDQVYEIVIHEEVQHPLALWDPCFVKAKVQIPK